MSIASQYVPSPASETEARTPSLDGALIHRLVELVALPEDTALWWTAMARRLDELDVAFWEHRSVMEGPSGLFAEVLAAEPRLAFALRACGREIDALAAELGRMRLLLAASMGQDDGVARVAASVADLVSAVRAHQGHVHTVLHEAFLVDIGFSG
ncbi:MAG: hypothetical protein AB7O74_11945 [Candidatus Nanopelagicales bacterium]